LTPKKTKKRKGYRTKYAGSRGKGVVIWLPFDPRKGVCDACGKSKHRGEIHSTALHHWWYEFAPKTVKENPVLALKNTSELCYYCHQLADAIRALLYARPERVAAVAELLEGNQRERFIRVLEAIIIAMKKTEKDISPAVKKIMGMLRNAKK